MPLTPAEKQKRYREKMKLENPDKYEERKKKDSERNKRYYRENVSQYIGSLFEEEKEQLSQYWRDSKIKISPGKNQMRLTSAEKQKNYREKLKMGNPDQYEEYKKRMAERSRLYYREKASQYTEEEKEKRRQHWRDSRRKTSPSEKQMPLTPVGRQKRYPVEEYKKTIAENSILYYREKAKQYTEDEKVKNQQWRDARKLSTTESQDMCEMSKIDNSDKYEQTMERAENSKCCNEKENTLTQTTKKEVKKRARTKLTSAERQKRYRDKLKRENPDKYLEIKKNTADHSRQYYREKVSSNVEEQWNDVRRKGLSPRERMKRYREKLKRENPAKYLENLKKSAENARRHYRKKAEQYTEEEKESSEEDAEPGPSEIPITPPWHIPDSSGVSDTSAQDPLRKHTDQCRFCGEFSSDCFVVSSHMPYLAGHRTTLALNDNSIHLDFNDGLPRTVCRYCDTKLQEISDFIKTVKDAQDSMHGKIKTEKEDMREIDILIKTETESTDGDSISISDTVFIKTISNKRKSDITKKAKMRKPNESSDGDSISISDTVPVKTVTNTRKSDMTKKNDSKPNVMVECENDVKQEVIDNDVESSRHSDADSDTLSVPDELKGADAYFCETAEETVVTEVIKKEKDGSETLSPDTWSENLT